MARYAGKTGGKRYKATPKTFTEDASGTLETTALSPLEVNELLEVRADNRAQFQGAFNKALARALEEIGLAAEGYAKRLCPVDTGRLRNSITHVTRYGAKAVFIGTNVEYARFVEKGTRTQKPQPYLRPAASEHQGTYRSILKNNLENG